MRMVYELSDQRMGTSGFNYSKRNGSRKPTRKFELFQKSHLRKSFFTYVTVTALLALKESQFSAVLYETSRQLF